LPFFQRGFNHEEEGLLIPDANETSGADSLSPLKFFSNYPSGCESASSSGTKKKKRKLKRGRFCEDGAGKKER
jgi:hypothetical protein